MKWYVILLVILIFFGGYLYISSETGDVAPLGRLAFVKLANPDMYPGHQHSELLAQYATERGSKCALVVHYKGTSRYLSYNENGTYIIEMAFESSPSTTIDWGQVVQYFLFGVPDDEWKIMVNGKEFDNYEDAWAEVMREAKAHGRRTEYPWYGTELKIWKSEYQSAVGSTYTRMLEQYGSKRCATTTYFQVKYSRTSTIPTETSNCSMHRNFSTTTPTIC